ncbi:MAG: hypothetical protein AAFN77_24300 [Planctomycetota bacterium]
MSKKEANALFVEYARTEWALKKIGYVVPRGDFIQVAWNKVQKEPCVILAIDDAVGDIADAIELLLKRPPRREHINESGKVELVPLDLSDSDSKADKVIKCLKRVRNNLVHGAKFYSGDWHFEQSTDYLKAALKVLRCLRESWQDLKQAFENGK